MNPQLIPCSDGTMADPTIGCTSAPPSAVSSYTNITEVILNIATILMSATAVIATVLLIYGGVMYALAAGDDEKIRKSKRIILWSMVGLAVTLIARTVAQFILGIVT